MRALAAVAVLFLVSACQAPPPSEMTDAEKAQIEAEAQQAINDRWDAYEAMVTEMDLDTWLSYWTADARLLEPGMNMSGSEIPAFGEEFFGSGGQVFSLDLESHEIFVHGDVAYQIGQYDEAFQLPGEERAEVQNYFFARWEKQSDGTWRIDRFLAGPRDAPAEG
jgi:ketosteroid isomerase-like protein